MSVCSFIVHCVGVLLKQIVMAKESRDTSAITFGAAASVVATAAAAATNDTTFRNIKTNIYFFFSV